LLVARLQQRIAKEFDMRIPMAELFHRPTVRQQAELALQLVKAEPVLPPGVLALQPYGARNSIFWVHYLNGKLAEAIGDDQPFLVVALTAEDFALLGKAPTLQSIAACLLRKILVAQPQGPYTIGGQCAGGILAYEIASQLRAAGREVSLLALLDVPNLSHLKSQASCTSRLNYLRYLLRRFAQVGLGKSWAYIRELAHNRIAGALRTKSARSEMRIAQEMIEAAAHAYQPENYEGRTLVVLASDRPPHRDFLPGWQAVVPHNLHTQYVNGHHRDLLNAQNARTVADAIISHHKSTTGEHALRRTA
jgi:thioesterase domain-containing protein